MIQTKESTTNTGDITFRSSPDEELAGPVPGYAQAVTRQERISSMDTLRGFALLGILLSNIFSFAVPVMPNPFPTSFLKPAFLGSHAHLNLVLSYLNWTFVEGKMRGIFTLLFGAGVILLTRRAEERGAYKTVADIFLRRNMWLALFGMLHAYLIWDGDVLYFYAITSLLFLYPCRHLKPRTLLIAGISISLVLSTYSFLRLAHGVDDVILSWQASAALESQKGHKQLTESQKYELHAWADRLIPEKTDRKQIDDGIRDRNEGYVAYIKRGAQRVGHIESEIYYRFIYTDSLGMMLIGMALIKNRFLTAELSYRTYIWTALIGFLVSIPLTFMGLFKLWHSGFAPGIYSLWIIFPFNLTRIGGALATASVILIVIKSGLLRSLTKPLAAVGQMALTNYLLTSIILQFVFLCSPWKLYGQLEYYQLYYVVLAMWTFNLVFSSIWLRYFNFGPMEWLWRSLTYWKRQSMLSRAV
ncbi:DUF418 domain-containing protein [Acidicapsa ligni]|uniref:DUF418 domain-containing protein n=1 Tax=Acidicapsa ligni TaxID=542300 RepID=UPI0021E087E9|nr:DUF418 domain-containing protein [Acidicapsa ligni]